MEHDNPEDDARFARRSLGSQHILKGFSMSHLGVGIIGWKYFDRLSSIGPSIQRYRSGAVISTMLRLFKG